LPADREPSGSIFARSARRSSSSAYRDPSAREIRTFLPPRGQQTSRFFRRYVNEFSSLSIVAAGFSGFVAISGVDPLFFLFARPREASSRVYSDLLFPPQDENKVNACAFSSPRNFTDPTNRRRFFRDEEAKNLRYRDLRRPGPPPLYTRDEDHVCRGAVISDRR